MKNPEPSPACLVEPLPDYREYPQAEMVERARAFHAELLRRRTVRDFDTRLVPREVIEACLLAAYDLWQARVAAKASKTLSGIKALRLQTA
jgi:hypothetical protein